MSKILQGEAAIRAEIKAINKAGATLAKRIQACAIASLEHMVKHRDHTLLVELYQAMPKGTRSAALAAWILKFSQLKANDDKATKKDKPFLLDKEKILDVDGAKATMWHDCGKPEESPDEILDVNKSVQALLARVKRAVAAGRPVKGLDADTLKALQALNVEAIA